MAATGSTDDCVQKNTVLEQLWDESSAAPAAEVQGAEVSKSLVKSGAGVVLPRSAEPRTGKESERGRAVEKSVASSVTDSGLPVPWEISGARAAEVAPGSEKPWCVPASACAQPSSFKGGGLRSSSICTGSDTDQG